VVFHYTSLFALVIVVMNSTNLNFDEFECFYQATKGLSWHIVLEKNGSALRAHLLDNWWDKTTLFL